MPLSHEQLMRRATAYLARRAASTARLRAVLRRASARADRIEPAGDMEPDVRAAEAAIEGVLERLTRAGLLDDAAFARMAAGSLARKGRPAGIIRAELRHRHGVDPEAAGLDEQLAALDPVAQATRWAERRRLGPYRLRDRQARRDRDIAALVRAGFPASVARRVVDGERPDADAEPAS